MARDVTSDDVKNITTPASYLVIGDVEGVEDIAKLPATALTTELIVGLDSELASKSDVSHTHPPVDPGDSATKEYVDERYAAGVALIVALDSRVTGAETNIAATTNELSLLTPTSIGAIENAERGVANGVATLGSDGLVPPAQLPDIGDITLATPDATPSTLLRRDGDGKASVVAGTGADQITNLAQMQAADAVVAGTVTALEATVAALDATDVGAIPTSEKGAALGVATLDASGLVTPAQLPAAGGSIALTEKGVALGVATLDAAGKHVLTELQDGATVPVTSTPYTLTLSPAAVRATSGAARIILPKTGSTREPRIINDAGAAIEVVADEGIVARGVKGNASRPTAEYAGIPTGLSSTARGFTCSWWGYLDLAAADQRVASGYRTAGTAYFGVGLIAGAIGFQNANASGTPLNTVSATWTPTAGLHHFMMAVDLTTSTFQLYVDGVDQSAVGSPTWSNTDIIWGTTKFAICNVTSDAAATSGWLNDIFQVWLNDAFIDLSVAGNRLLFYNAGPVNLGHNGWRPTGAPPAIFFNDTTFLQNLAAPAESWAAVAGRGSFDATTNVISGLVTPAQIITTGGASVSAVSLANLASASFAGSSDGLVWRQYLSGGTGTLSEADQTKLDNIEAGAQVNPPVLDNTAIDAGTATVTSTITAAGLKRGVTQHAVAGIGARAITAAMMPEVAANSILGNATGSPGSATNIAFSALATNIGSAPADQLVGYFLAPAVVATVTTPTESRTFQETAMLPWNATNAQTVVFFGFINTAGPVGTKIALVYETPLGSGTYYWFDGTGLGAAGALTLPVDENAAGVVDAGAATGAFYTTVTVPAAVKGVGHLRFGWKYYGGDGTGSLAVQGAGLRLKTVLSGTGGTAGVGSFNGRSGSVVATTGDYTADQITDGVAKVMMTTAERSIVAGVTSSGSTPAEWFSNDPSLANGGLKGSNTGAQNFAALQDLFTRMNASPADRKKLTIRGVDRAVFDILGSFAPAGYNAGEGWTSAANLTIDFGATQFNLQGSRTDYNQMRRLSGTWQELDAFTANAGLPYAADTDILSATRTYQKKAVFFDIRGCPNITCTGRLTINGNAAVGLVGIGSSGGSAVGAGCKGGYFEHLAINNLPTGMFADIWGNGHLDVFDDVSFGRLAMTNVGRAIIVTVGQANMMTIANLEVHQTLTSYIHSCHVNVGSATITCAGPAQLAPGTTSWTPAPKGIEVTSGSLTAGSLTGETLNTRGSFSIVNASSDGVLDIGVAHQDNAIVTQSGAMLTVCQNDAARLAEVATVRVGGVASASEGNPGVAVVGVPAVANTARSVRVSMLGRSGMTQVPIAVIPDYRATTIGGATSNAFELFETFSGREGRRNRRVSAGSLIDISAGGGSLVSAVSSDFTVVGGLLALARIGQVQVHTAAGTIGQAAMMAMLKAPAAATFVLTSDLTARVLAITNRGAGAATITPASGQILRGGSITIPAALSDAEPKTVCLWRDPSDNSWRIA